MRDSYVIAGTLRQETEKLSHRKQVIIMSTIARRIVAGFALIIASALIALGSASASHAAQGDVRYNGPTHSQPAPRKAFPNQTNFPKPGTPEHHRHQK